MHLQDALTKNSIKRNFSILGGEPLHPKNRGDCAYIVEHIRQAFPDIKIFLWTGYTYENLIKENDENVNTVLKNIDVIVDGLFIVEKRDVRLKMRGSSNQRIIHLKNGLIDFIED